MELNWSEMEQSHWQCFAAGEGRYYYGEVAYVDKAGVVSREAAPGSRPARHGFGVAIEPDANYQGQWDKDVRHGQGKLTSPGHYEYQGAFSQGCFHGQGVMVWAQGDRYEGNWKLGKMEGAGTYRRAEGSELKGLFKNNFFLEGNTLCNPAVALEDRQTFAKLRSELSRQQERCERAKKMFLSRVTTAAEAQDKMRISVRNNRLPLVVTTAHSGFSLADLVASLRAEGREVRTFDLKAAGTLLGEERRQARAELSQSTRTVLKTGGVLIINLNDSAVDSKQTYLPDLREFYDNEGFNGHCWSWETMKRPEAHEKILAGAKLDENFMVALWAKGGFEKEIREDLLVEKLKMKFESIIPLPKADIIVFGGNT